MSALKKLTDVRGNSFPNINMTYEASLQGFTKTASGWIFANLATKDTEGVECVLTMIVQREVGLTDDEKSEVFIVKTTEQPDKKYPTIETEELA